MTGVTWCIRSVFHQSVMHADSGAGLCVNECLFGRRLVVAGIIIIVAVIIVFFGFFGSWGLVLHTHMCELRSTAHNGA